MDRLPQIEEVFASSFDEEVCPSLFIRLVTEHKEFLPYVKHSETSGAECAINRCVCVSYVYHQTNFLKIIYWITLLVFSHHLCYKTGVGNSRPQALVSCTF